MAKIMKTIDGENYPSTAFLVVVDESKPSTWHLRVKDTDGKVDHRLLGAAWAALHKGFRGNKYQGPDKAAAIDKLKALYASEDMDTPTGEADVAEAGDISKVRSLLARALKMLGPEPKAEPEAEEEAEEAAATTVINNYTLNVASAPVAESDPGETDLVESASGNVVGLIESDISVAPLSLDIAIIRPGFGNKNDNHYYPAEMLKRDSGVFSGAKMYETDHRQNEKSTRTWVSTVQEIRGFTDDGAPIGRVAIHDEGFAKRVLALNEAGLLDKMECSILAKGRTKKGTIDGRETNIVEAITSASSVDWVTKAGAGGHALNLAESDAEIEMNGGDSVSTQEEILSEEVQKDMEDIVEEAVEEETPTTEAEPTEPAAEVEEVEETLLSEAAIASILADAKLPETAKARLSQGQYSDEDALKEAVQIEADYVKELTKSGQPVVAHGRTPQRGKVSLQEREAAKSAINQKWLNTRAKIQEE